MPDMNGYQVCEQLKADERLRGIPIIFISALAERLDEVSRVITTVLTSMPSEPGQN